MKISLLVSILLVATLSRAEDLALPDGTIFKNVSVAETTAAYISIAHDDGTARIKLSDLPDEWKTKRSFDAKLAHKELAEEALAAREKQSAKNSELMVQARHDGVKKFEKKIQAKIIQIVDGGLLAQTFYLEPQYKSYVAEVAVPNIPGGRHTHLVKQMKTVRLNDKVVLQNVVFIQGAAATRVGGIFNETLWLTGSYDYKNLVGEDKSVAKYTASREEAEEYHFGPLP